MTVQRQSTIKSRILGAAIVALSGLAIAGAAAAQTDDPNGARSVRVHYQDLNLSSPAGAREMLDRIRAAASEACGNDADLQMLERRQNYNQCKAETIARAVDELDAPMVTAQAGRTGAPVVLADR